MMLAAASICSFHACVAGWSTSNTRTSSNGLRQANVSSPAPSTRYCRTPSSRTPAANVSSASRARPTINARIPAENGCFVLSGVRLISSLNPGPRMRTASGSSKTSGRASCTWCAARRRATRRAVFDGCASIMPVSGGLRCVGHPLQRLCQVRLQVLALHDRIQKPVREQKLRPLKALRELLPDRLLDHARPGKAN